MTDTNGQSRKIMTRSRHCLPNSDSEPNFRDKTTSLIELRRHSDGQSRLPAIKDVRSKSTDMPFSKQRKKKQNMSKKCDGASESQRSNRSGHLRSYSQGLLISCKNSIDEIDHRDESHGVTESAFKLQPLIEVPSPSASPLASLSSQFAVAHTKPLPFHSNDDLIASQPESDPSGPVMYPLQTHTKSFSYDETQEIFPTVSELFVTQNSTDAEKDILPYHTLNPTQETIEGAGLYDPNINRLPPADGGNIEEAEERELKDFSNSLKEITAMIVQDNTERIERQYMKVINKYREQYTALKQEHEAEKKYLEKQIEIEKNRNKEGTAIQNKMGAKLEENRVNLKDKMHELQSIRTKFQLKKEEVAELREKLYKSEEELKTLRIDMADQNKRMSKLVPVNSEQIQLQSKMLGEMNKAQLYLDSMIQLMPDKKQIEDAIAKHHRLSEGRPITTGLLSRAS